MSLAERREFPGVTRNRNVFLYEMFTLVILNRLTLVMTRVIIIIIRMTASYLKAEHEIKQAVITVLVTPVCSHSNGIS